MSLACVTHGHPGCVGAEQDDCEIVTIITSDGDRHERALFTIAQILCSVSPESVRRCVPLLNDIEHADLVDRIRAHGAQLREAAGPRAADLWRAAQ